MLGVTRAVLGCSHWRDYQFLLPMTALCWRERIGIEPVCLLTGNWDNPRGRVTKGYLRALEVETHELGSLEGYEDSTFAQNCRQHAAALPFPDEAWLMLSDADLWPIYREFYHQHEDFPGKFTLYYANGDHYQSFPTCHQTARAKDWRELYRLKPNGDVAGQCKWTLDGYILPRIAGKTPAEAGWVAWMSDQWSSSEKIKAAPWFPGGTRQIERAGHPPVDRIDRSVWPTGPLSITGMVDAHMPKAPNEETYWPKVRELLGLLLPARVATYSAFRDAYTALG